jgi:hypothetical protein
MLLKYDRPISGMNDDKLIYKLFEMSIKILLNK